jgi:hypothetical protein
MNATKKPKAKLQTGLPSEAEQRAAMEKRTPEEQALADAVLKPKRLARPVKLKLAGEKGRQKLCPADDDHGLWVARMVTSMGVKDEALALRLMAQTAAPHHAEQGTEKHVEAVNLALAGLHSLEPRDGVEARLAAQMMATHDAIMECHRMASIPGQPMPVRDAYYRNAARLGNLYATQMQALAKYRNRGQQTVRVEHVTVHGNAIVGHVHSAGGAVTKTEDQPHARELSALTFASGEALPGQDQIGREMPAALHAERAL